MSDVKIAGVINLKEITNHVASLIGPDVYDEAKKVISERIWRFGNDLIVIVSDAEHTPPGKEIQDGFLQLKKEDDNLRYHIGIRYSPCTEKFTTIEHRYVKETRALRYKCEIIHEDENEVLKFLGEMHLVHKYAYFTADVE
jgi:hypothetical protein